MQRRGAAADEQAAGIANVRQRDPGDLFARLDVKL